MNCSIFYNLFMQASKSPFESYNCQSGFCFSFFLFLPQFPNPKSAICHIPLFNFSEKLHNILKIRLKIFGGKKKTGRWRQPRVVCRRDNLTQLVSLRSTYLIFPWSLETYSQTVPTLPDYPGPSWVHTRSPSLRHGSPFLLSAIIIVLFRGNFYISVIESAELFF